MCAETTNRFESILSPQVGKKRPARREDALHDLTLDQVFAGIDDRAPRATSARRVFTHRAREEDTGLTHGTLDEELDLMEQIVAVIGPGDLLLCNESFASANEAEGSQIIMEVTSALVHAGVQVRSVTHMYDFARAAAEDTSLTTLFPRAPRADTGRRSFLLEAGPPLPTSYGLDLYDQLFGTHYADVG